MEIGDKVTWDGKVGTIVNVVRPKCKCKGKGHYVINVNGVNEDGETLLFEVSFESMFLLLEKGVDMDRPNKKGKYFLYEILELNKSMVLVFEAQLKARLPEQYKTYVMLKNVGKFNI